MMPQMTDGEYGVLNRKVYKGVTPLYFMKEKETVYMIPELIRKLKTLAKKNCRTFSQECVYNIQKGVEHGSNRKTN